MFSSQEYVENKTGRDDLNRLQYLQALVTEFQDTSSDGIYFSPSGRGHAFIFRDFSNIREFKICNAASSTTRLNFISTMRAGQFYTVIDV